MEIPDMFNNALDTVQMLPGFCSAFSSTGPVERMTVRV